jgi:hypothetical protein
MLGNTKLATRQPVGRSYPTRPDNIRHNPRGSRPSQVSRVLSGGKFNVLVLANARVTDAVTSLMAPPQA